MGTWLFSTIASLGHFNSAKRDSPRATFYQPPKMLHLTTALICQKSIIWPRKIK